MASTQTWVMCKGGMFQPEHLYPETCQASALTSSTMLRHFRTNGGEVQTLCCCLAVSR
eukprot:m.25428 g.25428  ORF g.25428 m.25428 type:complete len:58 (-) comp13183_c0_seq1:3326-3499(-)